MAEPAELSEEVHPSAPESSHRSLEVDSVAERAEAGERWIAHLLRAGALLSGMLFLASLGLESLSDSERAHVLTVVLRRVAALVLLATPVVRLMVAGATLGRRGEWRYALYAMGVLGLLALAVGAGLHA